MTTDDPGAPAEKDPATVIALLYRIVDEPRRGFICAVLLLLILAAIMQLVVPGAKLIGLPAPALGWGSAGALGCSWLVRAVMRWGRRRGTTSGR